MTDIKGICDFLEQAGTDYTVYDMGRRIQPLAADVFRAFDQGETPWPFPLQQQAWLGIVVRNSQDDDALVIWFLRFPLDAHGRLTATVRDDFVYRLLNRKQQEVDDETNPYGFKPKQEHIAVFHAKLAHQLGKPASRFYTHAIEYLTGVSGFDQWAFVGLQGLADVCERLAEQDNARNLANALPQLPSIPFETLCQCLEHVEIPDVVLQALVNYLDEELSKQPQDANTIAYCLRALSGSADVNQVSAICKKVLTNEAGTHPEVLAAISGRCWQVLQDESLMHVFMEALAACEESNTFFNAVIVDLINIPGMQSSIHAAVRNPQRTAQLASAIGEMFRQFTN